ncbi:hypothetical protein [Vreelandella utahensis]|uniref:hypothetical protein n=1 Tax=Vreelandella halophila TaxID=86177 RepID=UPI0009869CF6|nr:hypothetical protein [Halomonas utahensis]
MVIEPMPRGVKRMRQCLATALMLGLFSGSVVAESAPSLQGKEPYELIMDSWELIKWEQKTPEDHICLQWLHEARGIYKKFTDEGGQTPESYKKSIRMHFPEGSVGYVLNMLATDATVAGKSAEEVGKLVWEKCQEYDPFYVFPGKKPNPEKKKE